MNVEISLAPPVTLSYPFLLRQLNSHRSLTLDLPSPTGYGYVQANPAAEHIQGGPWWTDYQVVSYKLQSKRGTPDQYKNMVDTCHAAGVKVIAGTPI